ncbi:hypothetical protein P153DRAFT_369919 [Dothidotthia symphoricarpi CBS 119687]|uniref:Uncharacterized protein n=1 Tax=Dothidotthia symphoricarpi CBS 119687 TaxID=1392245 RepID=A0A6A6A4V2_9PLEO|nr:uncharacterized protein P153DRAFT_369919 [Dothidotthia symphoricarpi CBS 119687]KAF2125927.1 hypothetical protein P153DRAFT_369919 [Dothidotthia symphoricarpi CBS 119687]
MSIYNLSSDKNVFTPLQQQQHSSHKAAVIEPAVPSNTLNPYPISPTQRVSLSNLPPPTYQCRPYPH